MKKNAKGMQVVVYDLGGNALSATAVSEIEKAVIETITRLKTENESKYTTLAHTVVVE